MPEQIQQLYHVHQLQPFDPLGFEKSEIIRYQDQWFQVAQQIRHTNAHSKREAWANVEYQREQDAITVLDAGQWIQDMTFPARLYLKTLGVENLKPEDIPAQDEPLVLDGLGRYAIRDFLQKQQNQYLLYHKQLEHSLYDLFYYQQQHCLHPINNDHLNQNKHPKCF